MNVMFNKTTHDGINIIPGHKGKGLCPLGYLITIIN